MNYPGEVHFLFGRICMRVKGKHCLGTPNSRSNGCQHVFHLRGGKVEPSHKSQRQAEHDSDFAALGHSGDEYLARYECKPTARAVEIDKLLIFS